MCRGASKLATRRREESVCIHFPARADSGSMKTVLPLACLLFAFVLTAAENSIYHDGWIDLNKNGKQDVYEDSSRPVQKRVNDLLKRMTLGEKIGQLEQASFGNDADKKFA